MLSSIFAPSGMKQLNFSVPRCHYGNIAVVSKVTSIASQRLKLWIGYTSCWGAAKTLALKWPANKRSSCLKNSWRTTLLKTSRENGARKTSRTTVTCTGNGMSALTGKSMGSTRGSGQSDEIPPVRELALFLGEGCLYLWFVGWRTASVAMRELIVLVFGFIEHP